VSFPPLTASLPLTEEAVFFTFKMNIVQFKKTMNTIVTSKEAIQATCRTIVARQGLSSVDMRGVAKACHVALGTLYNYYPSKEDLLVATIAGVWEDIFADTPRQEGAQAFPSYVDQLYNHIQKGIGNYPGFFTMHSVSIADGGKNKALKTMRDFLDGIKHTMIGILHADAQVSPDAFTTAFSETAFIDFVTSNILSLLMEGKTDAHILVEVVRRTLYQ